VIDCRNKTLATAAAAVLAERRRNKGAAAKPTGTPSGICKKMKVK
jgi:hypothetical protein